MRAFFGIPLSDDRSRTAAGIDAARLRAAIDVMRPKPSPYPMLRIGGDADGSYLLPDDIAGIEACFSPGVKNYKFFEDYLAEHYGITSHMCDKSSDPEKFLTPLKSGQQTFVKKWLDTDGGSDSIALQDWIGTYCLGTGDLLLQIDIEGAEYRNLLATPHETLRRFRIIVIELHSLINLTDPAVFDTVFNPVLTRLDQDFICVHAHPNNCCGEITVPGIGVNIPKVHELTFLRRDRFTAPGAGPLIAPVLPHPLDVGRNVWGNPPLFLNEAWFEGPRPDIALQKMREVELDYERFALKREIREWWSINPVEIVIPGENISIRAKCSQSSAYGTTPRSALARSNRMRNGSFSFHTNLEKKPWLKLSFDEPEKFDEIVIFNRIERCQDRSRTLRVSRSINDVTWVLIHENKYVFGGIDGFPLRIECIGTVAKHVLIELGEENYLHLDTVEIYKR